MVAGIFFVSNCVPFESQFFLLLSTHKCFFSDLQTFSHPVLNKDLYPPLTDCLQEHVDKNSWNLIVVKNDNMGGEGVFACVEIPQGTAVCHYGGEFIDRTRAESDMDQGCSKFLLQITVNNKHFFFNHHESKMKTFGCMMNHSSLHPNCTKKLHQNGSGMPVVIMKTLRNIAAGEELVHDYGVHYEPIPSCTVNCQKCAGKSWDPANAPVRCMQPLSVLILTVLHIVSNYIFRAEATRSSSR